MPKMSLKTDSEIAIMAEGGKILGEIVTSTLKKVKPGISTAEIDEWIEEEIVKKGGEPSFKKVPNYFWTTCTGLNDEVVHSIPRKDKIIKEGDLVKIDTGIYWKGFHNDTSWTIQIPFSKPTAEEKASAALGSRFLEVGRHALREAIKITKPGRHIGDISWEIQKTIEEAGFSPVKVLTGHGIGRELHEDPLIPCLLKGRIENTIELVSGMTLAIEIIYTLGSPKLIMENDNWTISTEDGKISGLFEETIALTKNGPLILTAISGRKN